MYIDAGFKVSRIETDSNKSKMAQLYFLESFVLPKQDCVYDHVLMVDDEDLFRTYPWGRLVFELLVNAMHKAASSKYATGMTLGGFVFPILT